MLTTSNMCLGSQVPSIHPVILVSILQSGDGEAGLWLHAADQLKNNFVLWQNGKKSIRPYFIGLLP